VQNDEAATNETKLEDCSMITEAQLAKLLAVTTTYLRQQRYEGKSIPFVKMGRLIRYRWRDVADYINSRTVGITPSTEG
jgi:hypothetical protein